MVAWAEHKKLAKERGALALELYVVVTTPVKSADDVKSVLPEHLAYQNEQEQAGKLMLAGPLSDLSGDEMQAMGMIVYKASSLQEAKAIADADPMHKTGTRRYEIRRWMVNEGSLEISVKLSAQSVRI